MAGGRPLLFQSVDELERKGNEYFANEANKPFVLAGLAYHLDCCTDTLRNYNEKPEFFGTIKRFKQRCEVDLCQMMLDKDKSTAGCIFQSVNNHGYINNTSKVDATTNGKDITANIDDATLAKKIAFMLQSQMNKNE